MTKTFDQANIYVGIRRNLTKFFLHLFVMNKYRSRLSWKPSKMLSIQCLFSNTVACCYLTPVAKSIDLIEPSTLRSLNPTIDLTYRVSSWNHTLSHVHSSHKSLQIVVLTTSTSNHFQCLTSFCWKKSFLISNQKIPWNNLKLFLSLEKRDWSSPLVFLLKTKTQRCMEWTVK